jgi:hypothetical protein
MSARTSVSVASAREARIARPTSSDRRTESRRRSARADARGASPSRLPGNPRKRRASASVRRSATRRSWTSSSSPTDRARPARARSFSPCAGRAFSRRLRIGPDQGDARRDLLRPS